MAAIKLSEVDVADGSEDAVAAPNTDEHAAPSFRIVAMGASAGGLDAFELFFRAVRPDSGMAFVLVQHLDPDHASMLVEILQRLTAMPVVEARDQMSVSPNCVYVIPPNREMTIFRGALQLSAPEQPRGHRMPIDIFMHSLAEDQGARAIGIILSGTGADGTLGLSAILSAGGASLVQEPATAQYDGMPSSAIRAGCATHIVAVDRMPAALLAEPDRLGLHAEEMLKPLTVASLNRVLMLLRSGTGHDFSLYKKSTVGRRIARRMSQHNIDDPEGYARYLRDHPAEARLLFNELLINVTSFFRDPEAFVTLKEEVLAKLIADKAEGEVFRVWVAGCSTGEETYSIAIVLRELMDETGREFKVEIFSTDLDAEAVAAARTGAYPLTIVRDVTPERLRRFFIKDDTGYRIKEGLREMVVFATHNAVKDPPFIKLDLLSCRNLMIYLETELQDRGGPVRSDSFFDF